MSDNEFINVYVKLVNDTLNEAFNKNLVLQAQLEIAKRQIAGIDGLNARIHELENVSSDNVAHLTHLAASDEHINSLEQKVYDLSTQLNAKTQEAAKAVADVKNITLDNESLRSKLSHLDTFKSELLTARSQIKELSAVKDTLEKRVKELEEPKVVMPVLNKKTAKTPKKVVVGLPLEQDSF
jgi:chromosome segregation ATPase